MRLLALAVLLVFPAADARPAGYVPIRAGDEVRIAGSTVRCVVQEAGVLCGQFAGNALRPGSYGTLTVLGQVVLGFRAAADGIHTKTLVQRRPKGLPSFGASFDPDDTTRVLTLRVGRVARLRVQSANLDCAVVRSGTRNVPTAFCVRDDKVGPVAKSYATLVSDEDAALGVVGKTRRTTIVWTRKQP
ncbi:MAG TPA: hypothetical protein VFJ91_12285 [Gaiellaceae bacterium]|nr:hypothetical protein [Gaiellaceae bacterium]